MDDIVEDYSNIPDSDNLEKDPDFTPTDSKRRRKQIRSKVDHESWTDENISKLISEVEIRPCLWNAGDKEYSNRNKRIASWKDISTSAFDGKIDDKQLVTKWQGLRCQYRTTLHHYQRTKSGQGASKPPHWKFFTQMSFIGDTEKEQSVQSDSNLSIEGDKEDSQTLGSDSLTMSSGIAQRKRKSVASTTSTSVDDATRKNDMDELMRAGMEAAIDRLQKPKQPADDIQTFGNYLVSELRKIKSTVYRQKTQRRLLQLLWNEIDEEPVK